MLHMRSTNAFQALVWESTSDTILQRMQADNLLLERMSKETLDAAPVAVL